MTAAVVINGLDLSIGKTTLIEQVALEVSVGTIVGIGGENGVGKSTLLRVLAGLIPAPVGTVEVLGAPPTDTEVQKRIGAAIDTPAFFSWMNGRSHLRTMQNLAGYADRGAAACALDAFDLGHTGRKPIFRYSQGMRKRLALAAASLRDPELLLLDEPTNALDPDGQKLVWSWLHQRRDAGATALIVSHRATDRASCDTWYELGPEGLTRV